MGHEDVKTTQHHVMVVGREDSTNTMARSARVAKGLVFHYFPSKDDLVSAAYEHGAVPLADAMLAVPAPWPRDLFERLHAFTLHKLRVFQRDPLAYRAKSGSTSRACGTGSTRPRPGGDDGRAASATCAPS